MVVSDDPRGKFAAVDAAVGIQEFVAEKSSHHFGAWLAGPIQIMNGTICINHGYAAAREQLGYR
jgi:hypothetical protein